MGISRCGLAYWPTTPFIVKELRYKYSWQPSHSIRLTLSPSYNQNAENNHPFTYFDHSERYEILSFCSFKGHIHNYKCQWVIFYTFIGHKDCSNVCQFSLMDFLTDFCKSCNLLCKYNATILKYHSQGQYHSQLVLLAPHTGSSLRLSCSHSDLASCWWPGRAVEDGPRDWTQWETWIKFPALYCSSSGHLWSFEEQATEWNICFSSLHSFPNKNK